MGGTIIRTSPVQIEVPTASEMPPVNTPELKGAMERAAAYHAERVTKRLDDEARAKKRRAQERVRQLSGPATWPLTSSSSPDSALADVDAARGALLRRRTDLSPDEHHARTREAPSEAS